MSLLHGRHQRPSSSVLVVVPPWVLGALSAVRDIWDDMDDRETVFELAAALGHVGAAEWLARYPHLYDLALERTMRAQTSPDAA